MPWNGGANSFQFCGESTECVSAMGKHNVGDSVNSFATTIVGLDFFNFLSGGKVLDDPNLTFSVTILTNRAS